MDHPIGRRNAGQPYRESAICVFMLIPFALMIFPWPASRRWSRSILQFSPRVFPFTRLPQETVAFCSLVKYLWRITLSMMYWTYVPVMLSGDFLHVQQRRYPGLLLEELKCVASTTFSTPLDYKSCSGWDGSCTRWVGHEILPGKVTTQLARQLAQEINYTFLENAFQDSKSTKIRITSPGGSGPAMPKHN
jgi:hypothetical protein